MFKYILLDFDGPLHPDDVWTNSNEEYGLELRCPGQLFMWSGFLESILDDFDPNNSKIKIILSTSWVPTLGLNRTLRIIEALIPSLAERVVDSTMLKRDPSPSYSNTFSALSRFEQIRRYVVFKQIRQSDWLAIDDLHSGDEIDYWPLEMRDNLVLCDGTKGLSDPAVQQDLRKKIEKWKL